MDRSYLDELLRSLTTAPSRRGLLVALSSGLLVTGSLALGLDEVAARKNRQHRRKKHRRRKKRNNAQQSSPLLPTPAITGDATCNAIPNSTNEAAGKNRLAQTFTALGSGPLVRTDLLLVKQVGEEDDYVLRLSPLDGAGVPTNTVLAETTLASATVPLGESLVRFSFAAPFAVVAGTEYALVLTRPGGDIFEWRFNSGDLCSGQSFVSLDQTGPFFAHSGDFIFTTLISA
jgi:hypothetical protein